MKNVFVTVLLFSVTFMSFGCSNNNDDDKPATKTFVIVHGAWQAPWAWATVQQQLQAAGQKVVLVELPGHGSDSTPTYTLSIDAYANKVMDAINAINGKVILVGHSMAGMVVSEVAEKIPTHIEKLVYISAYLPVSGQALLDLANTDAASALATNLIPSSDSLTLDVTHDSIADAFCRDCSADLKAQVLSNFRVEPAIPFTNPVTLTTANWGSVNKFYIHTELDRIVSIDLQNRMVAASGIKQIYSINASHCSFLSVPQKVTDILLDISKK